MELRRLDVAVGDLERVAEVARSLAGPLVLSSSDGAAAVLAAALSHEAPGLGVWLDLDDGYGAPMAARDVATLSWLTTLEHVVVDGANAPELAAVLAAMLTDEAVDLDSPVATLRGAYNRPAPPAPVTLWWAHGDEVTCATRTLVRRDAHVTPAGELTLYA